MAFTDRKKKHWEGVSTGTARRRLPVLMLMAAQASCLQVRVTPHAACLTSAAAAPSLPSPSSAAPVFQCICTHEENSHRKTFTLYEAADKQSKFPLCCCGPLEASQRPLLVPRTRFGKPSFGMKTMRSKLFWVFTCCVTVAEKLCSHQTGTDTAAKAV